MNYIYSVVTYGEDCRITEETNDICQALDWFFESLGFGMECHICSGVTGEILAMHGDEDYCTKEMSLIILGYLMEDAWGEEPEPAPQFPVRERQPSIFEVMSALSGQQMMEFAQTPEGAFMFPFICPSDDESEIVS